MKNLTTLFLATLLIFTRCTDPSEVETPAFSLEGTWELINITATGCSDPVLNGNNSNFACPPKAQLQVCTKYTFASGGTFDQYLGVYYNGAINEDISTGTYSLKGDKLTITSTSGNGGGTSTSTGMASLSGNMLTINWSKNNTSQCLSVYTLEKL